MSSTKVCLVIPAYQPGPTLFCLVESLRAATAAPILVVTDGSSAESRATFDRLKELPGVTLLEHA